MNVIEETQVTELRDKIAYIHRQFLEDETTECQYLDDYIAEKLYEVGYRKASDVAREFFNKIKELPRTKDFTVRSQDFKFGYMNAIQDILAELKKKYESEGENNA